MPLRGGAVTAGTGAEAVRWDEQRDQARSWTLRPLRPSQRRNRNKIGARKRTGGPGEVATEAARDLRDRLGQTTIAGVILNTTEPEKPDKLD
ncbi:hypothetical protein NDU88_004671 [Pleurodeles waltl]|uniref:Uncharacterized protein n=1 Tax=Pleurodeles waltl TaxID=8319 RepID=A0AAV7M6Y7_PLEWA|nr:hypothetical protein NDU88_004671 [Pleurodeles waltl]